MRRFGSPFLMPDQLDACSRRSCWLKSCSSGGLTRVGLGSPGNCSPGGVPPAASASGPRPLRHLDRRGDAAADPVGGGAPLLGALDGDVSHVEALAARLWSRCGCNGRALVITRGLAGCMRRRSCWWVALGPARWRSWMALPGIGRTTAGSILSSAFNASALPILDGNVKRVLARLTAHPRPPPAMRPCSGDWSEALLDPLRPRDVNQALMDLGATVCTPASPSLRPLPLAGCTVLPTLPAIPAAGP